LGAIRAEAIQATEKALIGARDLSRMERERLEAEIREGREQLPIVVFDLCRELLGAASGPGNGFRRVNRPALAFRYFQSMAAFFRNTRRVLRPGGKLAMVVGPNRTVLSGNEYVIDTPRLLTAIAEQCGYLRTDEQRMDTYPRYDLHQK